MYITTTIIIGKIYKQLDISKAFDVKLPTSVAAGIQLFFELLLNLTYYDDN